MNDALMREILESEKRMTPEHREALKKAGAPIMAAIEADLLAEMRKHAQPVANRLTAGHRRGE